MLATLCLLRFWHATRAAASRTQRAYLCAPPQQHLPAHEGALLIPLRSLCLGMLELASPQSCCSQSPSTHHSAAARYTHSSHRHSAWPCCQSASAALPAAPRPTAIVRNQARSCACRRRHCSAGCAAKLDPAAPRLCCSRACRMHAAAGLAMLHIMSHG